MTHQTPAVDTPRPAICHNENPIQPYIIEALQAALAWRESDCIGWALIQPNAAILAVKEIHKPARKPRRKAS